MSTEASIQELHDELLRMLREAPGYETDIARALQRDRVVVAETLKQLEERHLAQRFDDAFGVWYSATRDENSSPGQ